MYKEKKYRSHPIFLIFFISISLSAAHCILPAISAAAELISGEYVSSEGTEIVLELSIKSPPPSSVIIIMRLPKGTETMKAEPATRTKKDGEAKWLLKDLSEGSHRISLLLAAPLPEGAVSCEVRYRNPATGDMHTVIIK